MTALTQPKLPFEVYINDKRIEEPVYHIRKAGIELRVRGRAAQELPYLEKNAPQKIQPFSVFAVPLPQHQSWRDTFFSLKDSCYEINQSYFGKNSFLIESNVSEFSTPVQEKTLYRVHYVGTGNGANGLQCAAVYYTNAPRADRLVQSFSLDEILYLTLLHNRIDLGRIPKASRKKLKVKGRLDLPGEITFSESIAFEFPDVTVCCTKNGQPYDGFLESSQRKRLLQYLKS